MKMSFPFPTKIPTASLNLEERILMIKNTVTSPERMNLVQELRVELIA